jgi:hypothetical protein
MRMALLACALVLGGCFCRGNPVREPEAELRPAVGSTHAPYAGKPAYLAAARPMQQVARPQQPGADNPCAQRSRICDDRLRALLADVDDALLALSDPPTQQEVAALKLALEDLPALMAPYTDATAEVDELMGSVPRLVESRPLGQEPLKKRMRELVDLIRVQLAAAQ